MSRLLSFGLGAALCVATTDAVAAVAIDHAAIGCVVAAKFPRFEARFDPAGEVSRARLHFRPSGGPHWYSVAMKAEGGVFTGVLPKPKPALKRIEYYIEVTDASFGSSRTSEYAPEVAAGPLACKDRILATALESASVLLEAPAGAPLVPVGFDPAGVVATSASPGGPGAPGAVSATAPAPVPGAATGASGGAAGVGGIGTKALVIGGAVAAGAGAAIALGGGSDDGSSGGSGGSGGGGGSGGTNPPCTPGPVTASLANAAPAQRCGQRFSADVVVSNGSCSSLSVQSVQITQTAVAGPFCSAAVTSSTFTTPVSSLTPGQARTVFGYQSNVFCCASGPCPGVSNCTYNETFVVNTGSGAVPAGTLTMQVSFDPSCAPCP